MPFCEQCGEVIRDNAKFCRTCGYAVEPFTTVTYTDIIERDRYPQSKGILAYFSPEKETRAPQPLKTSKSQTLTTIPQSPLSSPPFKRATPDLEEQRTPVQKKRKNPPAGDSQLSDDKRIRHSYQLSFKIKVLDSLKEEIDKEPKGAFSRTARIYDLNEKNVRDWFKKERVYREVYDKPLVSKIRKGAKSQVDPAFDHLLHQWARQVRDKGEPVITRLLVNYANDAITHGLPSDIPPPLHRFKVYDSPTKFHFEYVPKGKEHPIDSRWIHGWKQRMGIKDYSDLSTNCENGQEQEEEEEEQLPQEQEEQQLPPSGEGETNKEKLPQPEQQRKLPQEELPQEEYLQVHSEPEKTCEKNDQGPHQESCNIDVLS